MAALNGTLTKVKSVKSDAKTKAGTFLDLQKFNADQDNRVNSALSDRNATYEKMLADSRNTAQQSTQITDRRRDEDYARQQVDLQNQRTFAANQAAASRPNSGGGSQSFGVGAAAPSAYGYNAYGQRTLVGPDRVAEWRVKQDGVLNDMYMVEKRSSDISRDREKFLGDAQTDNQSRLLQQQALIDSQRLGNERAFQSQQSDKDRANQRYLAQLETNARLQQSIFSGNGNGFQYWGGSI